jgi:N-acetylneuraminic acid mutarotase
MKRSFLTVLTIVGNVVSSNADDWVEKVNFPGNNMGNGVSFVIDGKAFLGTGSPVASAGKSFWEYNPASGIWTQKADFAGVGREYAAGFSIADNGFIGLGVDDDDKYLEDFWQYDPPLNSWSQKANFPGGKRAGAFSFATNLKAYVGAGLRNSGFKDDLWEYDPASDTWTQKADYIGGKVSYLPAFSLEEKGYVGLGYSNSPQFKDDFWEYDPSADTWTQKASFPGGARYGSVALSIGDYGYIGLGATFDTLYSDFWQYSPIEDTWIKKSNYPGIVTGGGYAFVISNFGYIVSGLLGEAKKVWQYIPDCLSPANLTTLNVTTSTAKLKWEAAAGAIKYKVQYKIDSMGAPWINKTVNAANTSIVINNLLAGVQYKWKVRSICSSEKSAYSPVEKFITQMKLSTSQSETTTLTVFPNPFNAVSTISFSSEENSFTIIELFEANGRRIKTLAEVMLETGHHEIPLDRQGLNAGIYFLKLTNPSLTETIKIIIE